MLLKYMLLIFSYLLATLNASPSGHLETSSSDRQKAENEKAENTRPNIYRPDRDHNLRTEVNPFHYALHRRAVDRALGILPKELIDEVWNAVLLDKINDIFSWTRMTEQRILEEVVVCSRSDLIAPLDAAGVNIRNSRASDGFSWLYLAVRRNSEAMVEALLNAGAQYDALLWDGWSLLEAALKKSNIIGYPERIMRASREVRKISGQDGANEYSHFEKLLEELRRAYRAKDCPEFVRHGRNTCGISHEEDTLLYYAVMEKYAPTVKVLLKWGANPEKLTLDKRSLIDIAIANKDDATVDLLLQAITSSYAEGLEGMN